MEKISAKNVLYIKLGDGGRWEDGLEKGYLKIGFREANHSDCLKGNWDIVRDFYINDRKMKKKDASNFVRQIKSFYTEMEDTLWITFAHGRMWWSFIEKEVILNEDGTKIRYVKKKYPWSDRDIDGKELNEGNINGSLWALQSYKGTICKVPNNEYVINKINGDIPQYITEVKNAKKVFEEKLKVLIRKLRPKDFELLIDLIFRYAGWKRNNPVGGITKVIDIDLTSTITHERAAVQIKSKSTIKEFKDYVEKFAGMTYDKYFYFVSNDDDFLTYPKDDSKVKLVLLNDISSYVIDAGLVDWVIEKAF